MKLDIFSHCVVDTIYLNNSKYVVPGGPACYCSLIARSLKFDVTLHTKFGSDFPLVDYLDKQKIKHDNSVSDEFTTKFTLKILGSERTLFLENQCEPINDTILDSDSVLISPVFDEISNEAFMRIKRNANFVLLDPQGFLRRKNSENKIYLENTQLDFSHISAIKTNPEELECITGGYEVDNMKILQKNGIEYVILTDKQNISVLSEDKIYSIKLPNTVLYDTTGVGDIFSAAFCCTMIKENDILWALSFAGGAVQATLDSEKIGLEKIPPRGAIETNAYYFYNTVKFRQI
jgi:sugar/nucleoside kinase (ribokinase family)